MRQIEYTKREWKSFCYYHLYNQGYKKQVIFHEQEDYYEMCKIFSKVFIRYRVEVLSFCIMSTHYHILAMCPTLEYSQMMKAIHQLYTKYYRKKYCTKKVIWKKYFEFKEISQYQRISLLREIRYIHYNPVKANMVKQVLDYPYSSAKYFTYYPIIQVPSFLVVSKILNFFQGNEKEKHRHFMQWIEADAEIQRITTSIK